MKKEDNNSPKYICDLSGKFLFMRHGQTWFNKLKGDESRRYNPELCDAHLSDIGINQIKTKQEIINKLNIEKIYVSPYYRALQTVTLVLENHPNKENIEIIVHPLISEIVFGNQDFLFDIKKTKKDFNMNSKIKIDWSYFDEYIKKSKYDENFFYYENMNLINENEKNMYYLKWKEKYDKGDFEDFKKDIENFLLEKKKNIGKFESLKHGFQRFEEFKKFLKNEHKDTIYDKSKKVLCVCHAAFINTATSPTPFLTDKIDGIPDNLYQIQNGEIITFLI